MCIWEAASVDEVRNLLEPLIGRISRNEYFPVENREGFARPVARTTGHHRRVRTVRGIRRTIREASGATPGPFRMITRSPRID